MSQVLTIHIGQLTNDAMYDAIQTCSSLASVTPSTDANTSPSRKVPIIYLTRLRRQSKPRMMIHTGIDGK